jgi:3-hydroxyacyl-CoA dehydrogenase/enoyl-CoA hydratase/3-hydroxybutyryl-CoA epimerase
METIRLTTDSDWITTIWIDVPAKGVNTISPRVLAELDVALNQVEHDRPQGLIVASAKNHSFIAGADLFEIGKMDRQQMLQFLADGQTLFSRIANLSIPTVAAINGDCLGGGLELALACSMRVAAADASISIGLPEVKLGILPGWGGTVRLPKLIGLTRALPLLLAGKTLPPNKALRAGIVDEVVRPEALLSAAKRLVMAATPIRRHSVLDRAAASVPLVRNKVLGRARKETLATTFGNYPAPMRLIEVVRTGCEKGEAAGLDAERAAIAELMDTDASRNLIRLFFLKQGAKRQIADQLRAKPGDVKRAAVIGGGTMGAGIVHALVRAGIDVRLVEVDVKAVSAGLARVQRLLNDDVSAGRLDRLSARNAMNRVAPCTDWTGLHLADIVIEAVLEEMPAKKEVFGKLDRLTRPEAGLATNTSSLSVAEIAEGTAHPERVIGLHFFNPVAKMPLVEIIRTESSGAEALATAAALAVRLGKTPVLVRDAPGFLVNRILTPYLAEALAVAAGGVPIERIDAAMKQWGMPMGPFELLDTIGVDVALHVLTTLGRAFRYPPPIPRAMELAMQRHWLGNKSGRGFYEHGGKHPHKAMLTVNADFQQALSTAKPGEMSADAIASQKEAIAWRLILPMVNEAARALEENVTDSVETIDLATVLGLGLAPFRGGLVQFANAAGTPAIVNKLEGLERQIGPRFAPATLLRNAASRNQAISGSIAGLAARPKDESTPPGAERTWTREEISPSPGIPGEGRGEGDFEYQRHQISKAPSP